MPVYVSYIIAGNLSLVNSDWCLTCPSKGTRLFNPAVTAIISCRLYFPGAHPGVMPFHDGCHFFDCPGFFFVFVEIFMQHVAKEEMFVYVGALRRFCQHFC